MYRNETNTVTHPQTQQQRQYSQEYVVKHDFDGSAKLTTTLAHALSDVSGNDVTGTGFTLYEHVDPDALDKLFKPKEDGTPRMNGCLTFSVWGHQVTVYSDGQIAIVSPHQQTTPRQ